MRTSATTPIPSKFHPSEAGLMTLGEYIYSQNKGGKILKDYDLSESLKDLNYDVGAWGYDTLYPVLLHRFKSRGKSFEVRAQGKPRPGSEIAVFVARPGKDLLKVGRAKGEHGTEAPGSKTTFLSVAPEYSGHGIGGVLKRLWSKHSPDYTSGGLSVGGLRNFSRYWNSRVREFLANGWYTELVKQGRMEPARVKKILKDLSGNRSRLRRVGFVERSRAVTAARHSYSVLDAPYLTLPNKLHDMKTIYRNMVEPYSGGSSSRTTPAKQGVRWPKPGEWAIDGMSLMYGRSLWHAKLIDPKDLEPSESSRDRMRDVDQYEEWLKQGLTPPPIRVIQTKAGKLRVTDGHRRWLAHKRLGRPVLALVSYAVGSTGLTWEIAVQDALKTGLRVPDHILSELERVENKKPDLKSRRVKK